MLNHAFTSLQHHFSDYKETHLLIQTAGDAVPDLAYLQEQKVAKIQLDARDSSEEVLQQVLAQLIELKGLRSLVVSWKGHSFPRDLTRFHNLQHLAIDNEDLVSIPSEWGRLDRLRSLYLDTLKLLALPKSLHKLRNLRELFLDAQFMESLPSGFARLQNLEIFGLRISDYYMHVDWGKTVQHNAKWKQSTDEIFALLAQLPKLRKLSLLENDAYSSNYREGADYRIQVFKRIPESLENLSSLEELELWHSTGVDLPECLHALPRLQKIWAWRDLRDEINRQFPDGVWNDEVYPGFLETDRSN